MEHFNTNIDCVSSIPGTLFPKVNREETEKHQNDPKIVRYKQWLDENGAIYPSIEYPVAFGSEGLVGAMAKCDISSQKAFIFVPYTITISPDTAKDSELRLMWDENKNWFDGSSRANDDMLYLFIMYEIIKGEQSFWHPYFEIVPEIDVLWDWSSEDFEMLQDPYIAHDAKKSKDQVLGLWYSLQNYIKNYPQFFPPELDLQRLFILSYKLVTTRSFAWEKGMVIPLADNINHADLYVQYESKTNKYLLSKQNSNYTAVDYSDFSGRSVRGKFPMANRTLMNRLEKYVDELAEYNDLKICNNIWEVDELLKGYVSSSDDDEMRNEPDEYEDESESEESEDPFEEFKGDQEYMQNDPAPELETVKFFMYRCEKNCSFEKGQQVYNCYGRLNNHDLLLDYGFCYFDNRYDSMTFRMWDNGVRPKTTISIQDIKDRSFRKKLQKLTLGRVTRLFKLKFDKLNTDIFTYYRKQLVPSQLEQFAFLRDQPFDIRIELLVIEKLFLLFAELNSRFTTLLSDDVQQLQNGNLNFRQTMSLHYRISQKKIFYRQIELVKRLKTILLNIQAGNSFESSHLPTKNFETFREMYPLREYLRELWINQQKYNRQ